MTSSRILALFGAAALLAAALLVSGCGSRAATAQKLFEKGDYEQVIEQYPDLEVARRARVKLADKLLQEGKRDVVLRDYSDTRAAHQARLDMADEWLKQGKYQTVLDSFPGTPAATQARAKLADSLYEVGAYDELVTRFGDTPRGTEVKEQQSQKALADAKKLKGDAKMAALEELVRKYSGTSAYKEASALLQELRQAKAKKK